MDLRQREGLGVELTATLSRQRATTHAPPADPRLEPPAWDAGAPPRRRAVIRLLVGVEALAALWYFGWLLQPGRIGQPLMYGLLLVAELFNAVQAIGFWWTAVRGRVRRLLPPLPGWSTVDVFIPVCGEPAGVVGPTIAAALRMHGAHLRVWVLDDGDAPEIRALAEELGATYLARRVHHGAKAGNINDALGVTSGEFVVVLDCDHVPQPHFLERTLGEFVDPRMAFVQTPQYYANASESPVASAAWAQQSLFFGSIARGKDAMGAMFCAGTNVVLRRTALADVRGFPEDSLTEDFEMSIRLHERGWTSSYVSEVLASGLGPTDMGSYVGQQLRWSRGCLSAVRSVVRARLPFRLRAQYLLSSMYFLSGWTLLIYMSLPVVRMLTGYQPLAVSGADQFLVHFAPYFALSLLIVARAGRGSYSFGGFALAATCWWVHVISSLRTVFGRKGRFVVTPKRRGSSWQPRAVAPTLLVVAVLVGASVYSLCRGINPSTINNVSFALLHVTVLLCGAAAALKPTRRRKEDRERI
jgi:cellulose synthase (UDP-forming)